MRPLLFILFWASVNLLLAQEGNNYAPNRMIARLTDEVYQSISHRAVSQIIESIPQLEALGQIYGKAEVVQLSPGNIPIYCFEFEDARITEGLMYAYRSSGVFNYVECDYLGSVQGIGNDSLIPNDSKFNLQWSLYNDGSFWAAPVVADADIDMTEAWIVEQGDTNIIVGIIDSGCKLDHPELNGRIWVNYQEIPGNGIDDDGNTYVDDWRGWDFANTDNNPTDDFGHGTNVTGIIGCNGNNSLGFAGVDWHCKLMILKGINSSNWGYYSWWIAGINYAVDKGVNVLNLSLGGTDPSQGLQDAIANALSNNVIVVASMMNANNDVPYIPASYPGVIAVGATDPDDTRSNPFFWSGTSGSCYGSHISVIAPGNYIYGLSYNSNTSYNSYWGGTSQAAPHVAGLSSLLLSQDPDRTPADIKAIIQNTSEDQVGDQAEDTPGWDPYYGYGRINAYAALIYDLAGISKTDYNTMRISPNPTNGEVKIQWDTFAFIPETLTIQSLLGNEVMKIKLNLVPEKYIYLNLSALVGGVYIISLEKPGKRGIQKLVVYE